MTNSAQCTKFPPLVQVFYNPKLFKTSRKHHITAGFIPPLVQVFSNPKRFKINGEYSATAGFSLMTESYYRRVYRHKSMHAVLKEAQIQYWH